MIYTEKTKRAMKLCYKAHEGQVDKSGLPYVHHPFHLAEQMEDEASTIVALLHDVVEDTSYTINDLKGMGFGEDVIAALVLLTHDEKVPYMDYVRAIRENPLATKVKLADLEHNMDLTRLNHDATFKDKERRAKYQEAQEILRANDGKGMKMIRIRPYMISDAEKILSWCDNEDTFSKWTFGLLGEYPITKEKFQKNNQYMQFTAIDGTDPVGYYIARNPHGNLNELRFGYGIVRPDRRNQGIGKEMLNQGLIYAFEIYGADRVTLGVYEKNYNAISCYKAIGFTETGVQETYEINGEQYLVLEMECAKAGRSWTSHG